MSDETRMTVTRRSYVGERRVGSPMSIGGVDFVGCEFAGCVLTQRDDPTFGLVVHDVALKQCRLRKNTVVGARFESVLVENVATAGLQRFQLCVFNKVTFRGRAGGLITVPPSPDMSADLVESFNRGMASYYENVEWALDISEAEFDDCLFTFVPGNLVVIDPDTQVIVTRQQMAGVDLASLPQWAADHIERMFDGPFDSIVIVAPKRSKRFERYRSEVQTLREIVGDRT